MHFLRFHTLAFFFWISLLAIETAVCLAASPQPSWAKHGMVATAEKMAAQVGAEALKNGGNAVDAAAAAALALGVTEGYASGIGGGCFILIRMADGRVAAIDGRETAPMKASRLMYVPRDTTKPSTLSTEGVLAAGTPGELAALELAVRTYGKQAFSAAFEGAIALADTGFTVDQRYARALTRNVSLLGQFEGTRAVFFKSDSVPLAFGDRLVQRDLARTLRSVQANGMDAFYSGEIPTAVDSYMKTHGGALTTADFAGYAPVTRKPVQGSYRGYDVISMPPPSSGGIHVIQILNLVESFPLKYMGAGSSESLHLIAEAMQIAFADRAEFLGDPDFVKIPEIGLVSKDYAESRIGGINRLQHRKLPGAGNPWSFQSDINVEKHTTNLCVVDSDGNMVAITATVNTPFGCGVIVPGTGFILNNEMDDFVTWPGHPNFFGLVGSAANEIEPRKRPLSSMCPTILVKDGKPFMAVGSMGGPRIITSVVQTILNVIDHGMSLQAAMDAPRIHEQWVPDQLFLEDEIPDDVVSGLTVRGHTIQREGHWSAVTAVMVDTTYGGWWGASDSRVNGAAAGY